MLGSLYVVIMENNFKVNDTTHGLVCFDFFKLMQTMRPNPLKKLSEIGLHIQQIRFIIHLFPMGI